MSDVNAGFLSLCILCPFSHALLEKISSAVLAKKLLNKLLWNALVSFTKLAIFLLPNSRLELNRNWPINILVGSVSLSLSLIFSTISSFVDVDGFTLDSNERLRNLKLRNTRSR